MLTPDYQQDIQPYFLYRFKYLDGHSVYRTFPSIEDMESFSLNEKEFLAEVIDMNK